MPTLPLVQVRKSGSGELQAEASKSTSVLLAEDNIINLRVSGGLFRVCCVFHGVATRCPYQLTSGRLCMTLCSTFQAQPCESPFLLTCSYPASSSTYRPLPMLALPLCRWPWGS